MMGTHNKQEARLFYYGISLEERIRKNHPLRKIKEVVDFSFVREEVKELYGYNGNQSIDPDIVLRMMFLVYYYNVRSEREFMDTIAERLDWLWFLEYDLESEIPDHSVLSKARTRWGTKVFRELFERIVLQCVEAGLVEGKKIYCDSSDIDANASNNSVVDRNGLKRYLNKRYQELEDKLEEKAEEKKQPHAKINNRYISTTDPDATIVRKAKGNPKLKYKVHRAIDEKKGVITASETTTGSVNEGQKMMDLVDSHEANTDKEVTTVVADSQYGTYENYRKCMKRKISPHLKNSRQQTKERVENAGIYSEDKFIYDEKKDVYLCPEGKELSPRKAYQKRKTIEYSAKNSQCQNCQSKQQCTKAKNYRTLKRHYDQELIDQALEIAESKEARNDLKYRQHFMERNFAQGLRYGLKRTRWRGLEKTEIHELLIASIQNIGILIKGTLKPVKEIGMKVVINTLFTLKRVFHVTFGMIKVVIPFKKWV